MQLMQPVRCQLGTGLVLLPVDLGVDLYRNRRPGCQHDPTRPLKRDREVAVVPPLGKYLDPGTVRAVVRGPGIDAEQHAEKGVQIHVHLRPGVIIGKILKHVEELQFDGEIRTREEALEAARRFLETSN